MTFLQKIREKLYLLWPTIFALSPVLHIQGSTQSKDTPKKIAAIILAIYLTRNLVGSDNPSKKKNTLSPELIKHIATTGCLEDLQEWELQSVSFYIKEEIISLARNIRYSNDKQREKEDEKTKGELQCILNRINQILAKFHKAERRYRKIRKKKMKTIRDLKHDLKVEKKRKEIEKVLTKYRAIDMAWEVIKKEAQREREKVNETISILKNARLAIREKLILLILLTSKKKTKTKSEEKEINNLCRGVIALEDAIDYIKNVGMPLESVEVKLSLLSGNLVFLSHFEGLFKFSKSSQQGKTFMKTILDRIEKISNKQQCIEELTNILNSIVKLYKKYPRYIVNKSIRNILIINIRILLRQAMRYNISFQGRKKLEKIIIQSQDRPSLDLQGVIENKKRKTITIQDIEIIRKAEEKEKKQRNESINELMEEVSDTLDEIMDCDEEGKSMSISKESLQNMLTDIQNIPIEINGKKTMIDLYNIIEEEDETDEVSIEKCKEVLTRNINEMLKQKESEEEEADYFKERIIMAASLIEEEVGGRISSKMGDKALGIKEKLIRAFCSPLGGKSTERFIENNGNIKKTAPDLVKPSHLLDIPQPAIKGGVIHRVIRRRYHQYPPNTSLTFKEHLRQSIASGVVTPLGLDFTKKLLLSYVENEEESLNFQERKKQLLRSMPYPFGYAGYTADKIANSRNQSLKNQRKIKKNDPNLTKTFMLGGTGATNNATSSGKPIIDLSMPHKPSEDIFLSIATIAYNVYQKTQNDSFEFDNLPTIVLEETLKYPPIVTVENVVQGVVKGIKVFINYQKEPAYQIKARSNIQTENPQAWGQDNNEEELKVSQMLGWIATEAVLWELNAAFCNKLTKTRRARKVAQLANDIAKAELSSEAFADLIRIANMPKGTKQQRPLLRFMNQSPKLSVVLLEEGTHLLQ